MGKQHLGLHVSVGYGIKIFWPGLFITSPDHLVIGTLHKGVGEGLHIMAYMGRPSPKGEPFSGVRYTKRQGFQSISGTYITPSSLK